MTPQLDKELCSKYPLLFRDRHGNMRETAMCWGFEVGDGWYTIIDRLCARLEGPVNHLKDNISSYEKLLAKDTVPDWVKPEKLVELKAELEKAVKKVPVVLQVKEKFGGLRFYVSAATEEQYAIIHFVEGLSNYVCETCGATKNTFQTQGWIKTTCKGCCSEEDLQSASDVEENEGVPPEDQTPTD